MKLFIERENTSKELEFNGSISQLLSRLSINSEEVLVTKDNELLTDADEVQNSDEIRILSVISGG